MSGKGFITVMGAVPKKPLSRTVRGLVQVRSKMAIRRFAARYGIAVEEAEKPIEDYAHILDFFTRRLKPGARPLDPDPGALLSPVDAKLDAAGRIEGGALLQAKGRTYALGALLADEARAARYEGGTFATLYLSPRDYHRIHSPADADVAGCTYVPGELWPVNPAAVSHVDALFARNERVITHLETERFGAMELVMVGATCVGHMTVAYDEEIATNTGATEIDRRSYAPPRRLARGDELGVFEMGSTVILIVGPGVKLDLEPMGRMLRMGQRLGAAV
jgi:phosphatidylserine decarboxylase